MRPIDAKARRRQFFHNKQRIELRNEILFEKRDNSARLRGVRPLRTETLLRMFKIILREDTRCPLPPAAHQQSAETEPLVGDQLPRQCELKPFTETGGEHRLFSPYEGLRH